MILVVAVRARRSILLEYGDVGGAKISVVVQGQR